MFEAIGKKEIFIAGISAVTTNENGQSMKDIGLLWDRFSKNPIRNQFTQVENECIYSVYSDYENKDLAKYRVTIGYALAQGAKAPENLKTVVIPKGVFKSYQAKSRNPSDLVDVWQKIWSSDPGQLPRNFIADFEVYNDDTVTVFLGLKKH